MCELHAHCPNCGRDDLDDHEVSCSMVNSRHFRAYRCPCGADITVTVNADASPLAPTSPPKGDAE